MVLIIRIAFYQEEDFGTFRAGSFSHSLDVASKEKGEEEMETARPQSIQKPQIGMISSPEIY